MVLSQAHYWLWFQPDAEVKGSITQGLGAKLGYRYIQNIRIENAIVCRVMRKVTISSFTKCGYGLYCTYPLLLTHCGISKKVILGLLPSVHRHNEGHIRHYHMASENLLNFGSSNGLVPDSTKALPEPMLISHLPEANVLSITLYEKSKVEH